MTHAESPQDLDPARTPVSIEGPGWFAATLINAAATAVGLAVAVEMWSLAGYQAVSAAQVTAYLAAIHGKVKAHRM
jgi:hypothetical protein